MKICLDPKSMLKYQFQLEMAEFTNSFIILLFQIVSLSQGLNTIQTSKEKHHNVRQQLKFFDEKVSFKYEWPSMPPYSTGRLSFL